MVCQHPTMSVASSAAARRLYTPYESCAPTACATRRYRPSTGRSLSPSYSTQPVLGGDSPTRPTGSESMLSSAAASAAASVRRMSPHSRSSAQQQTSNCSTKFRTPSTYYTTYFPHLQWRARTTTFDLAYTTDNYRITQGISLTQTS